MNQHEEIRNHVRAMRGGFHKEIYKDGENDPIEMLEEYWAKHLANSGISHKRKRLIKYDSGEIPGQPVQYVYFATLPGGGCFATFEDCYTKMTAKKDAAEMALMNSVLNNQSCYQLNDAFIEARISEATTQQNASNQSTGTTYDTATSGDRAGLEVYRSLLETKKGRSVLEFQQMMTIFQLLHWSGKLRELRNNGYSRQNLIDEYSKRPIDGDFKEDLATDWTSKEREQEGVIEKEIRQAECEIEELRKEGRELRFSKEKLRILRLASNYLHTDYHLKKRKNVIGTLKQMDS